MRGEKRHELREAATRAGLHYVTDGVAGIRRRRSGKGWSYYAPNGSRISDPGSRKRLNALAIPPAWTDVWICPDPNGHIQATARDARGRKQYRYHPSYRETRDRSKFRRMLEFRFQPQFGESKHTANGSGHSCHCPAARLAHFPRRLRVHSGVLHGERKKPGRRSAGRCSIQRRAVCKAGRTAGGH